MDWETLDRATLDGRATTNGWVPQEEGGWLVKKCSEEDSKEDLEEDMHGISSQESDCLDPFDCWLLTLPLCNFLPRIGFQCWLL